MDLDRRDRDLDDDTNSNCSATPPADETQTGDRILHEDYNCIATQDTLADGITSLLKPAIDNLDSAIQCTRLSQLDLKIQLESLATELKQLSLVQHYNASIAAATSTETTTTAADKDTLPSSLDKYCTRLVNTRLKITVVGNILEATQERLKNLSARIDREQNKRRSLLEPNIPQQHKAQQDGEPNIDDIISEIEIGDDQDVKYSEQQQQEETLQSNN
ncbi:SNAPIN protein homolog isoform X2 [Adelges cooleyi]|uniref:SNAPIN protein homolog isoform X2 n=1 Tax=Adelges cooleyi TaxID=133065 RepID=UPI00217F570C|nr:SNAPIN protein homolog isoform X2 [Adelges cooleyi]